MLGILLTVLAVIMYCLGFVFLYGVVRLAVRHGIQDVNQARHEAALAEKRAALQERTFLRENAFLAGG